MEVKQRHAAPNRYTWEIHREHKALPVEEARDRLGSWEEASQAGKKMLKKSSASVWISPQHRVTIPVILWTVVDWVRGPGLSMCGEASQPTVTQAFGRWSARARDAFRHRCMLGEPVWLTALI